ncbi:hypothetical protein F3J14_04160 [Burkholderia sp. Tr-862]|uniref:hypothetical protein n=1 Tax=Burkholderia sp. Tr-862 TaxID=2608331 RepID=UPI00141A1941|nr:hypothetical protein [Burkholderia sp. Tr-862]NIF40106.1 hypothetical protein [Burkholderia sp. Tr-862]
MSKLLEFLSLQKIQRASIAYLAWTMPAVTLLALLYIVQQQAASAHAAIRMAHTDAPATVHLMEASARASWLIASLAAATIASAVAYVGSWKRNLRT